VSGADIYRQMIENYLANNPGGVGVPETAAALLKNIPTGRGYHARQYYEYGGAPGGPVSSGGIGSGTFQGETGPTSFGSNTQGLFSALEPGSSLGGSLSSGGLGGTLPGGFTAFGGGGAPHPTVKYL